MSRLSINDASAARSFVQALALPDIPRFTEAESAGLDAAGPVYQANKDQAVVVGSQIAEFAAAVPRDLRPAISNSFLLAQLAANKQTGQAQTGSKAWYEKYNEVLANVGWVVESDGSSMKEVKVDGLELHKEILPVIATVLGPAVAAATVVTAALSGLANMNKDSPWITLFNRQSQRATANQFQISYADAPGGAAPRIKIACFELVASRTVTQVLFFKFSDSRATLNYSATELSLNQAIFDQQKSVVEQRLASYVSSYVAALDI